MTTDLATFDDEEGFYDDATAEPKYGIKRGRYVYPAPPGYIPPKGARGFMRMTNLAAAFSEQVKLQKWRERMIMLGLRTEEGEALYDELMAADLSTMDPEKELKPFLEMMAEKISNAAGAGLGARKGTARHIMLQAMEEAGVLTGSRTMRLQLHSLYEALERHYLAPLPGWSERRVCNTKYGTMGTLDLGVQCTLTGQRGILDLKTQRGFWSYQEICGQQEGYDSADWVWDGPPDDTGGWLKAPEWDLIGRPGTEGAGKRIALLAHMPSAPHRDAPMMPVEIHEVDLSYGESVMRHALSNVELRSRGKSVAKGRRPGWVREVPKIQTVVG